MSQIHVWLTIGDLYFGLCDTESVLQNTVAQLGVKRTYPLKIIFVTFENMHFEKQKINIKKLDLQTHYKFGQIIIQLIKNAIIGDPSMAN